ncbi:MAG: FAD-dependent oxidoreductase [Candidatus Omnitrophica bacterium]|nr:FAD-dependent oxidoreductase [Candidatus Omnitrophota bacterium]
MKFLKEAKVVRIDPKKHLAVLKDNTKINYDYLVIASGQKVDIPDIPGKTKDGVFAFYNFEEIKEIRGRALIANTVCLWGEPAIALKLGEIFLNKGREVKIISKPKPEVLPVSEKLEWIDDLELSEIIGEGAELKAIKLSNGKAIGVDLFLFVGNLIAASEFLKDTDLKTEEGYILVNDAFQANFEDIFACGSVARKQGMAEAKSWEAVINEGQLVANKILEGRKLACQQTS